MVKPDHNDDVVWILGLVQQLKQIRLLKKLSQGTVGKMMLVSASKVSDIENLKNAGCNIHHILNYARVLDVRIDYTIVPLTDPQKPPRQLR